VEKKERKTKGVNSQQKKKNIKGKFAAGAAAFQQPAVNSPPLKGVKKVAKDPGAKFVPPKKTFGEEAFKSGPKKVADWQQRGPVPAKPVIDFEEKRKQEEEERKKRDEEERRKRREEEDRRAREEEELRLRNRVAEERSKKEEEEEKKSRPTRPGPSQPGGSRGGLSLDTLKQLGMLDSEDEDNKPEPVKAVFKSTPPPPPGKRR
jgi:hypothetical protein